VPVTFRASVEVRGRMDELAAYHGRSRGAEIRLALAIHDTKSTLVYFDTPEGKRELGDELEQARAELLADLEEYERVTYRPRPLLRPKPEEAELN
jgi:hypothetical protein